MRLDRRTVSVKSAAVHPGVERPAHRLGREAVDGGAAARLDVGSEAHERPETADERPGGDGGEVGLDEDVVDGGGQVRRHGGRHVVDRVGGGEQGATGLGQRPSAGDAEPVGLAKDRLDGRVEHGSGPVGSAPGEALAERAVVGRAALRERGELAQHLAPDRPDRRPLDVRAEGVGGSGAGAPVPDEVGCAGRAEPGEGQRRPPVPGLARAPLVDLRRRSPHRHDLAVVGDEARGIRQLDDEGGVLGVEVERLLGDPEVTDRQATGAEHAWWVGAPGSGELVDVGEALARGSTGGGVDEGDRAGLDVGRGQLGRPVQATAPQHEAHLAGQRDAVGRHGDEQVVLEQPPRGRASGRVAGSTPKADPHVIRSSMARESSGASAMVARIRSGSACSGGADGRSSCIGAPRPATAVPSTSGTVRTTWSPSAPRHRRADRHRSCTMVSTVVASSVPSRCSSTLRSAASPATTMASSTWRWPRSRARDGPLHAGRVPARAASARQVGRRRAREIRAREHEVDELCVAATADVVGEAPARGGHPPNLLPWSRRPARVCRGPPLALPDRPLAWPP